MRMKESKYLFVDGGYFRKIIEKISYDFFNGQTLPIDYSRLASGCTKAFYYDCLSPRSKDETIEEYGKRLDKQREDFTNLRLLNGWHVIEGVVGEGKKARQKQVDIQIAVDMLTHSFRRNMDRIAFIAGDQDFKPLVESIVREGMYIELWYENTSASNQLIYSADGRREFDVYQIYQFLTSGFQKKNSLPRRYSKPGKDISNSVFVGSVSSIGGGLEVYKSDNEFMIVAPCNFNEGYNNHMAHFDYSFLKKVYESVHGLKDSKYPPAKPGALIV